MIWENDTFGLVLRMRAGSIPDMLEAWYNAHRSTDDVKRDHAGREIQLAVPPSPHEILYMSKYNGSDQFETGMRAMQFDTAIQNK